VYGFYLPASEREGLSTPQAVTTLTVLLLGLALNRAMMRGAKLHGPVQWGKISVRGMITLVGLAAVFTWVMGLMGYIRSSGRLSWHVNELMPDVSPWSFTPSLGFAAKMVTINMAVFWLAVFLLFWISRREPGPEAAIEPSLDHAAGLADVPSMGAAALRSRSTQEAQPL